jgi:hypothetical protein
MMHDSQMMVNHTFGFAEWNIFVLHRFPASVGVCIINATAYSISLFGVLRRLAGAMSMYGG